MRAGLPYLETAIPKITKATSPITAAPRRDEGDISAWKIGTVVVLMPLPNPVHHHQQRRLSLNGQ